jgi:ATP synthase F1 delta subunit
MREKIDTLSKKYAQAYINCYTNDITLENIKRLEKFSNFLITNQHFYAYLNIPNISYEYKKTIILNSVEYFNLPNSIEKLLFIMFLHKRIDLLDQVIQKIIILYQNKNNIISCNVTTSHQLSNQEESCVESFIKKFFSNNAIISFSIDKKLISGIKINSDTLLWERSIAKKLNDIKNDLLQRMAL